MVQAKRVRYTQDDVHQMLAPLASLDLNGSPDESLEALAPVLKAVHDSRQGELFIKTLRQYRTDKENEIAVVCKDNFKDFHRSVEQLLRVRQTTIDLKSKVTSANQEIQSSGKELTQQKQNLLQNQIVATNVDDAVSTMKACLEVLDSISRVGVLIQRGGTEIGTSHFSALKTVDELASVNLRFLSSSAPDFAKHLAKELPSLRLAVRDSVTSQLRTFLLNVREKTPIIGRCALDAMEARKATWKRRKVKDPALRSTQVNCPMELVLNERSDFNPLENDQVQIDFKPLLHAIHIFETLGALPELQRSYQGDRHTQASLIYSNQVILSTEDSVSTLKNLWEQVVGFFTIEHYTLKHTNNFRHENEVQSLWNEMSARVLDSLHQALDHNQDPDVILTTKLSILTFIQTLDAIGLDVTSFQELLVTLSDRFSGLLNNKFGRRFQEIIVEDEIQPMQLADAGERDVVSLACWGFPEKLRRTDDFPMRMPFSKAYPACCDEIRRYVDQFYQFVDGSGEHQNLVEDHLSKSIDALLQNFVGEPIKKQLVVSSNVTQAGQIVSNVEYFLLACTELGKILTNMRSTPKTSAVRLNAVAFFSNLSVIALEKMASIIGEKLDTLAEVSEYDWNVTVVPKYQEPSDYMTFLADYLMHSLDAIVSELPEHIRDLSYNVSFKHISTYILETLIGTHIQSYSVQSLFYVQADIIFMEQQAEQFGKPHAQDAFKQLRYMLDVILQSGIQKFVVDFKNEKTSVLPTTMTAILKKIVKWNAQQPSSPPDSDQRQRDLQATTELAVRN